MQDGAEPEGFPGLPRVVWVLLGRGVGDLDEICQLLPPGDLEYLLPCLLVTLWRELRLPCGVDDVLLPGEVPEGDCPRPALRLGLKVPPGERQYLLWEPFRGLSLLPLLYLAGDFLSLLEPL